MQSHKPVSLFPLSLTLALANAAWAAAPEYRVTIVGPRDSFATDINNAGAVTGFVPTSPGFEALRGFVNRGRGIVYLDKRGAASTVAVAINDKGVVLGNWRDAGGGRLLKLDERPDNVPQFTTSTGIDNRGHVVGTSDRLSGFIYRRRRMESLNALIDPGLGWSITAPQAINDAGQVAANAIRNGVQYAVRLDLIRKSAESAPQVDENDHEAGPIVQPLSQQEAAADARAEAEAQAREVAQPVRP